MRNILAVTVFMFGLAGGAMAQDYQSGPDAPITADAPSTDSKQKQKEAPQQSSGEADPQLGSTQQDPCNQAQETHPPDQTPQNDKACTSSDALSDVANCY
jgi:hypothetical protein